MGKKVVLITGASSGIGLATAKLFIEAGHIVYGTSRKHFSLDGLKALQMDVRMDASVQTGVQALMVAEGRIDLAILNAGYGIAGSVEDADISSVKEMFETNYFGTLRVVQSILPHMRRQKNGCIIAVSSIAGVLSIPFQSTYSASKFALEATMEALRGEVKPFGIQVSLVEPGDTKTGFTKARILCSTEKTKDVYRESLLRSVSRMEKDEEHGVSPTKVGKIILQTAMKRNPAVRIAVGMDYRILLFLKRLLPDRLVRFVLQRMYAS